MHAQTFSTPSSAPLLRASVRPLLVAASLALLSQAAAAQAFDAVRLYGAAPGKDGGVAGLAVVHGRDYAGSASTRTMLVPLVDYQWANGWFAGVTNGVGYNFSRTPGLQYGLRVTADFGRKEKRSPVLRGLGDVDPSAEAGAFLNYSIDREFFLTSSVRVGQGEDHRGALLDLGAGYSLELAPGWRLGAGVATTLANADYLQTYFGVNATQSAASGLRSYKPSAGLRDVRLNLSSTYRFDPRIGITTALSSTTLLGDAKDSPIVRKKNTIGAVVAVSYAF